MIEVIRDMTAFGDLREEWTDLLASSRSDTLFLTWEWLHTWWRHLGGGRRLRLMTVRQDGRLTAIAPLAQTVRRPGTLPSFPSLEFIGTGQVGSDYLDVIVRSGSIEDALPVLAGELSGEISMLRLIRLRCHESLAADLARVLGESGWSAWEAKTDICPYIPLQGHTWESYLGTVGAEHRYNVRRRLRNLSGKFEVRFERAVDEDQRQSLLAILFALHDRRWRSKGGTNAFHTPALRSFHEEMSRLALRRGWLRLYVLWLDGSPAAALYGFAYRRTFYFYQAGFDPVFAPFSVGLIAKALAIKSAIEEGLREYDLLHGEEAYKFLWTKTTRDLVRMEIYPPGRRGALYRGTAELGRAARRAARSLLPAALARKLAGARERAAARHADA